MAAHGFSFIILEHVDSTNNYAMAAVHEGMAKHGDAVFAHAQSQGKGQRGKQWHSGERQNIALSIVLKPGTLKIQHSFQLSVTVALAAYDFFNKYAGDDTSIKWPNDIYWRDRKAGGILIENVISGNKWKWAVAGIGININQATFDEAIINAVSLRQITSEEMDTEQLARELYENVMNRVEQLSTKNYKLLLEEYQQHLFRINSVVKLKRENIVFETTIKGVSAQGHLLTKDAMEREFEFGEVEWAL